MESFVIQGGKPISGTIAVRGSKNATLPLLAASLLADGPCVFKNVPQLRDVQTQIKILNTLGVQSEWSGRTVKTKVIDSYNNTAPYELVKQMRAGVCVLGPLLAKRGECEVSLPGGCVIGERPN